MNCRSISPLRARNTEKALSNKGKVIKAELKY